MKMRMRNYLFVDCGTLFLVDSSTFLLLNGVALLFLNCVVLCVANLMTKKMRRMGIIPDDGHTGENDFLLAH